MLWFKTIIYLVVLMSVSTSFAGSYEDFFVAVKRNDGGAVTQLLQQGFDPNTPDPSGKVALVLALQSENFAVVEALMARPDLNVNVLNPAGESPLMMAALRGNLAWCERLLAHGASINKSGWTPLHYAATGPEPKVVKLLLERGAVVDAESPDKTTPLMMAARYGKEESVTLLLVHGADPKRINARNMNAADFARGGGREWLAERLSKAGS
ncbi:MAG: ankyrin repeat domain-containing protein [Burkholderiales bacterium]